MAEEEVLPSLQELRQDVSAGTGDNPEALKKLYEQDAIESKKAYAQLSGLQRHYSHKAWWSLFLMVAMASMIGFQSYLLYKVGSNQWNFEAYDWLLPALLVQNLAQIAGLCVIVVKALFTEFK